MPRADYRLSVPLNERPSGFLSEISPSARGIDMVDGVRTRLDQIGALLWMMRNMDDLAPGIALALGGIETAVEDAGALLSVHSARGAA